MYMYMQSIPSVEGCQCLGIESALCAEGVQQDVGGAWGEGGTGGEAIAGSESDERASTQRHQRWNGEEMTNSCACKHTHNNTYVQIMLNG